MAFGKSSSNFDPNTKLYRFHIKSKDLPAPIFVVSVREGEEYVPLPDSASNVSGDLTGITYKENLYQGAPVRSASAVIRDKVKNEVYFLDIPFTFLGRGIINAFANLTSFNGVEIGLYKSKPKVEGKDGFHSAAVRQGGQLVYGRYLHKDLPEIKKVQVGPKLISDTTVIDEFFKAEVEKLSVVLKGRASQPAEVPVAGASQPDDPAPSESAAPPIDDKDPF